MEKSLNFHKVDGTLIEDVELYVKQWAKDNPHGQIMIGCDSQVHGKRIKYSTVIVMHFVDDSGIGHGGHLILADNWEKRVSKKPAEELPVKLWSEAEYVLIAANMVNGSDEMFKKRITVHLDFNEKESEDSNIMFAAGIGYINAMGYTALGKPHAPIATHSADHYCR